LTLGCLGSNQTCFMLGSLRLYLFETPYYISMSVVIIAQFRKAFLGFPMGIYVIAKTRSRWSILTDKGVLPAGG